MIDISIEAFANEGLFIYSEDKQWGKNAFGECWKKENKRVYTYNTRIHGEKKVKGFFIGYAM